MRISFLILLFFSGVRITIAGGGIGNQLIDTAFSEEIYKKNKKIYNGIYVFDKTLPMMDDKELSDILKNTSKVFNEQLQDEIIFLISKRIEISDIFEDKTMTKKVAAYCGDYIIDLSSACDLNSFSELFETYPKEENKQIIFGNLRLLFSNPKVREKFPLSAIKYYFQLDSEKLDDILTAAVKTYVDTWNKISEIQNKNGEKIFSRNDKNYSIHRWRAYFNRYDAKDIDFIITNVPLIELSDTPTLHLMKRGGMTGGTILSTISPFLKNKTENKNIILLSHFIYYFENDVFKSRDLKTKEEKQNAFAYTFLMEYIHDKFSAIDNYKADNILKPANGFKFKEWYEKSKKNIFKESLDSN